MTTRSFVARLVRFTALRLVGVASATLLGVLACSTSDLVAPNCYDRPDKTGPCVITGPLDTEGDTTDPNALTVDCSAAPRAAAQAEYAFTPVVTGGTGPYQWWADGLPEGLVIDATTGAITGQPNEEGPASFVLTVRDGTGASADATCELTVAPALALDHEALLADPPFCITGDATLLDRVVPGTGDGSPVTCTTPNGSGNGRVPEGITVDPDTCALTGRPTEARYGTSVFMVRGRQSGRDVWAPYCVTDPEQPERDAYTIEVAHSGLPLGEGTLVPLALRYDPEEAFAVGGAGDDTDPRFVVSDPSVCEDSNSCYFGYLFGINASPFDADTFTVEPAVLALDDDEQVLGFSHTLFVEGPPRGATAETLLEFAERPWVLVVDLAYCLADTRAECDTDVIRENGRGTLRFGVIMFADSL